MGKNKSHKKSPLKHRGTKRQRRRYRRVKDVIVISPNLDSDAVEILRQARADLVAQVENAKP